MYLLANNILKLFLWGHIGKAWIHPKEIIRM